MNNAAIVIAPYDPRWVEQFRQERDLLLRALGEWAVAIEHVGSTAVPGLAAKPIIDIGVALRRTVDALRCITPLCDIGYECRGEFGIPGRIFFRKLTDAPAPGQAPGGTGRTHQVHMYEQTHEQFINHLALRDFLRAHPETAAEYERLKRRLAREHTDVESYAAAKTDFIRGVLAQARAEGYKVAEAHN